MGGLKTLWAGVMVSVVALVLGADLRHVRELRESLTTEVQLGIDLGTTQSVAALCVKGNVSVVSVEGHDTTPSTVWFSKEHGIKVGRRAVAARSEDPGNVIYAAKRVMGIEYSDPEREEKTHDLPFAFAEVQEAGPWRGNVGFELPSGRVVSPEQVGALVIKKLKSASERSPLMDWLRRSMGFQFTSVTVSVPVTFTPEQKKATVRACKMAGLSQVRLVEEPVAAAMAYGLGREKKTDRVLVFDIGGGTLDVALLYFNSYSATFYVETTAGDSKLGGEDFDMIMAETVLARSAEADRVRASPTAYQRLLVASERAKRELSSAQEATVCLPGAVGQAECHTVTREQFRAAGQPTFERAMASIQQVLEEAGLDRSAELDIVLVGGSSRIPAIREEIAAMMPRAQLYYEGVDPDLAVAVGAAKSWGCN